MTDALTRIRVLRLAGFRCSFRDVSGQVCGATASLVAHPSPMPNPAPMIAVCRDHAQVARP